MLQKTFDACTLSALTPSSATSPAARSRSSKMRTDVCVIGAGGVVGSAIVRHLSLAGMRVVALEKHAQPAQETSGANSGVIHSGFHETAGTLKAELAGEGSAMVTSYAERRGVPLLRCGMLIAIPANILTAGLWGEAGALW